MTTTPTDITRLAELVNRYAQLTTAATRISEEIAAIRHEIITLGITAATVAGHKITVRPPAARFDQALAKTVLHPGLYAQCLETKETFSTTRAKQVLTGEQYAQCQKTTDGAAPTVTIREVDDAAA